MLKVYLNIFITITKCKNILVETLTFVLLPFFFSFERSISYQSIPKRAATTYSQSNASELNVTISELAAVQRISASTCERSAFIFTQLLHSACRGTCRPTWNSASTTPPTIFHKLTRTAGSQSEPVSMSEQH